MASVSVTIEGRVCCKRPS